MSLVRQRGARSVVLLDTCASGENTLLRSMQSVSGVEGGDILQADDHVQVSNVPFMDEDFCIFDCGRAEGEPLDYAALISGVDAAVLVCSPDPEESILAAPYLKILEELQIPTFIFVGKIDQAEGTVHDLFRGLENVSFRELLLRQIPILEGAAITGYVDLASERAFIYQEGEATEVVELPPEVAEQKGIMRIALLEALADYDDELMEDIMDDVMPVNDAVFTLLKKDVVRGSLVPVFLGSAEKKFGIRRLLKALRHEVPENEGTIRQRHILAPANAFVGQVLAENCRYQDLNLLAVRIWSGQMEEGMVLRQGSCEGLYRFHKGSLAGTEIGEPGEVVFIPAIAGVGVGHFLTDETVSLPHLVSLTQT